MTNNIPPHGAPVPHILVFDSGVGGLSIVGHLRGQLPHATISYLADNQHFPYGTLQPQQLTERIEALLCQLSGEINPDLIVVACNTASTLALPALRASLPVPIVGVVPAIKPAAQITESNVVGLIATPGTISRDYTDELIAKFASELMVIRLGTTELVMLVEEMLPATLALQDPLNKVLNERCLHIVQPLLNHPQAQYMDTVVLACTHFPLIQPQLAAVLPQVKYWIDSGEAIARRVANLLDGQEAAATRGSALINGGSAFMSNPEGLNEDLISLYRHYGFSSVRACPTR